MRVAGFRKLIWSWYRRNGRYDLPWRKTHDPYKILVSEVMLQQTQVSRVIPKYHEFLRAFPSVRALARAPLATVLRVWQGLGYNRRALNVKRMAEVIVRDYGGVIPSDPALLRKLPGVGMATAGAVAAFAFNRRVAFLETNIRRVFIHFFFPRRKRVSNAEILEKITATLPDRNIREWYWALMDYGALVFTRIPNPNRRSAHYARQPRFAGSRRQLRGRILAEVLAHGELAMSQLRGLLPVPVASATVHRIVAGMVAEGFMVRRGRWLHAAGHS